MRPLLLHLTITFQPACKSEVPFWPLTMNPSGALCSHDPLYFATKPQARSEMTRQAASRLLYISNWKLNSESACEEPRLRRLLGHISVYDKTRTFTQTQPQSSEDPSETNELSTYLHHQVPSFREFQAAIEVQLAAMAQVTAAAAQLNAEEYNSDEEEDDSDYDSYDGDDWSEDEDAAESDDSFTDTESVEGQRSECSSPTGCLGDTDEEEEKDLWALRPLTPFITNRSVNF